MKSITPTAGRVVYFNPNQLDLGDDFALPRYGQPLAAIIAAVLPDGARLNLTVLDAAGQPWPMASVPLVQEGGDTPETGGFAYWMPYQLAQAGIKRFEPSCSQVHPSSAMPSTHPVQQVADAVGGTIESVERLPDGSGAAVMSMPLPADHWLTQPGYNVPPMKFRMGTVNPCRAGWVKDITEAGRYAVRCATMNGAEDDFDPDALVQNLVVGMLGYFTPTGLSADADANPQGVNIPRHLFDGSTVNPADAINTDRAQLEALGKIKTTDYTRHAAPAPDGESFGTALEALDKGYCVARRGWNGKGLFVYLVGAASYPAQTGAAKAYFGDDALVPYAAYMALKGADGQISTWAPSCSDALAKDWIIVNPGTLA